MNSLLSNMLVPIDGSDSAARALESAWQLVQRGNGHLTLLYATDDRANLFYSEGRGSEDLREFGASILACAKTELSLPETRVSSMISRESPVRAIVEAACAIKASLIVMATHGRGGFKRVLMGSVADGVLRAGDVPLLLLGPKFEQRRTREDADPNPFSHILVALDDSELSDAALTVAIRLARELDATLTCCNVMLEDHLDRVVGYGFDRGSEMLHIRDRAQRIAQRGVVAASEAGLLATGIVGDGYPLEALMDAVDETGADFIVMGAHGRRSTNGYVLGGFVEEMVRRSRVPVLVTRTLPVDNDARRNDAEETVPSRTGDEDKR